MNPSTGMTTYFKAMGTGFFKAFGTPENSFWCCTGTGMENFTKLGDSVYFHDATDLYVTYYVSSTLNWKDRGFSLSQTTDLPLDIHSALLALPRLVRDLLEVGRGDGSSRSSDGLPCHRWNERSGWLERSDGR